MEIWKLIKTDREACGTCIAALAGVVVLLAGMLAPYMPSTSASLVKALHLTPQDVAITDAMVAAAQEPHKLIPGGCEHLCAPHLYNDGCRMDTHEYAVVCV